VSSSAFDMNITSHCRQNTSHPKRSSSRVNADGGSSVRLNMRPASIDARPA
jgi:hypothetical protein